MDYTKERMNSLAWSGTISTYSLYLSLSFSKKWMLAFSIDKVHQPRCAARVEENLFDFFSTSSYLYWAVCCWWKKRRDFVVRKIKRKEEILKCVDGWTKLTFSNERELCECVYENHVEVGAATNAFKRWWTKFPRFFDIKISIKNKSHPFEDDRLRVITAVGLFTRIILRPSCSNPHGIFASFKFHQNSHFRFISHARTTVGIKTDEINFIYYYYFIFLSLSLSSLAEKQHKQPHTKIIF